MNIPIKIKEIQQGISMESYQKSIMNKAPFTTTPSQSTNCKTEIITIHLSFGKGKTQKKTKRTQGFQLTQMVELGLFDSSLQHQTFP